MQTSEIIKRIKEIIAEHFDDIELPVDITDEELLLKHLNQDLSFDSIDVIELVMLVEKELNIRITDDEMDVWNTIGDVVNTCEAQLK